MTISFQEKTYFTQIDEASEMRKNFKVEGNLFIYERTIIDMSAISYLKVLDTYPNGRTKVKLIINNQTIVDEISKNAVILLEEEFIKIKSQKAEIF